MRTYNKGRSINNVLKIVKDNERQRGNLAPFLLHLKTMFTLELFELLLFGDFMKPIRISGSIWKFIKL